MVAAAANDPGERGGSRAARCLLAPPSCGAVSNTRRASRAPQLVGRRCACRLRSPARSPRSPPLPGRTPRRARAWRTSGSPARRSCLARRRRASRCVLPCNRHARPPRFGDQIGSFRIGAAGLRCSTRVTFPGGTMRRISVRAALLTLGLGLLSVGTLRGDPVAPCVDPPFTTACGAIHHFGEGVAPPLDGCAFDPLCAEYEKRDIRATHGGPI